MKDLLEAIRKIKPDEFTVGIVLFLSLIAPGFVGLYLYDYPTFEKIDVFKLILLSISLTLPSYLGSFTAFQLVLEDALKDRSAPNKRFLFTVLAGLSSLFFGLVAVLAMRSHKMSAYDLIMFFTLLNWVLSWLFARLLKIQNKRWAKEPALKPHPSPES